MNNKLLRHGAKPSIYKYPDDPDFVESVILQLEPREKDQGQLSFWEYEDQAKMDQLIAAIMSRSSNLDKLNLLCIECQKINDLGFEIIQDPDPETYPCISQNHRSINLSSKEDRFKIAQWLKTELTKETNKDAEFNQIEKSRIRTAISLQYQCSEDSVAPFASDWALALFRAAQLNHLAPASPSSPAVVSLNPQQGQDTP